MNVLDLREIAEEWRERIAEMGSSVPDTEGMSYGEVAEATEKFLAEDEQQEYVEKYVSLCGELGLDPAEPDTLEWHANNHEPTLIAEDDFAEYAEELATDLGYISDDTNRWPFNHIDWEAAADELRQDYTTITYDGDDYLIRS
jgi:hypothetical protein